MDIDNKLKEEINLCKESIERYNKDTKFNQQILAEYIPFLDNPTPLLNHWIETGHSCKLKGIQLGPNFQRVIALEIERQYALKYSEADQIVSFNNGLIITRKISFISLYLNGYEANGYYCPYIRDIKKVLLVVPINFVEIDKAIKTPQIKAIFKIVKMIDSPTRNFNSIWELIKEYNLKYDSSLANNWINKRKLKKELRKPNGYLRLKQGLNDLVMRLGYYNPSKDPRLGKTKQLKQEYLDQLNYLFNDILKLDIPIKVKFIANLPKR